MTVPNASPNTSDVAIGIKNWACNEVSKMIGAKPAMVVKLVSSTALNLKQVA